MTVAVLTAQSGFAALAEHLENASADSGTHVVTLLGLGELTDPLAADVLTALDDCPVPVIAGLSGAVNASGLFVAAACDIVVADVDATISLADVDQDQLGYIARLLRTLPGALVRRMLLLGEPVSAEEIGRLGAVQIVTGESVKSGVERLARELDTKSPTALRLLKHSMVTTSTLPVEAGVDVESIYSRIALASPDGRESAQAFLEKRAPVWAAHGTEGQV